MSDLWVPSKDDAEERRIRIPLETMLKLYEINGFTKRVWVDHKGVRHEECWDPRCPSWGDPIPFWADECVVHWHRAD